MRPAPLILELAADVTRERDDEALRRSLIQTLNEVLTLRWITIENLRPDAERTVSPLADPIVSWLHDPEALLATHGDLPSREAREQLEAGQSVRLAVVGGSEMVYLRPLGEGQVVVARFAGMAVEDVWLLESFCRLYENFVAVIRDASRDRLTGLQNRRSFDDCLGRLASQVLRPGQAPLPRAGSAENRGPLHWWLAMFDVDHFKRVNDDFGHLYGDEVLLLLARLVQQTFRGEDRCFRYGGEEFAVLLARNDEAGTRTALERLRARVENYAFPQVGQVTVSIGCAPLLPGVSPAEVLDQADKALYEAKNGGRNRLRFHLPAQGPTPAAAPRRSGPIELF